jgi:hypothetical protein
MRRDTEFRWQPEKLPSRSKLALSLVTVVAGLATAHMFVHAGRQSALHEPGFDTTGASALPPRPASGEPSGIATAAPLPIQLLNPSSASHLAESDEPSGVATAPGGYRAPYASSVPSIERDEPAPRKSAARRARSSGYATLRQALLRKIR